MMKYRGPIKIYPGAWLHNFRISVTRLKIAIPITQTTPFLEVIHRLLSQERFLYHHDRLKNTGTAAMILSSVLVFLMCCNINSILHKGALSQSASQEQRRFTWACRGKSSWACRGKSSWTCRGKVVELVEEKVVVALHINHQLLIL